LTTNKNGWQRWKQWAELESTRPRQLEVWIFLDLSFWKQLFWTIMHQLL
jgi:hypothetical protein